MLEFDSPSLLPLPLSKPLNHVSGIVLHIFGFPPFPASVIMGEWTSVAYLAKRETLCSILLLYSQLKRWGSTRKLCWDKRNWSLCRPVNYKGHGLQWLVSAFWQKPPGCGHCPSQLENILPPPLSFGKHSCTPPGASCLSYTGPFHLTSGSLAILVLLQGKET